MINFNRKYDRMLIILMNSDPELCNILGDEAREKVLTIDLSWFS